MFSYFLNIILFILIYNNYILCIYYTITKINLIQYLLTKTEFILISIIFLTSAAKSRISKSPSFLLTLDSRSRYFYYKI